MIDRFDSSLADIDPDPILADIDPDPIDALSTSLIDPDPIDSDPIDTSFDSSKSLIDEDLIDPDPTEFIPRKKADSEGLTAGQTTGSLAIDIGGSIGSQLLGATFLPLYVPIAFTGGLLSSVTAQTTAEGRDFDDISWGRAIAGGLLNLIPGSSTLKVARPIAREALKGGVIGAADVSFQKAVDEQRLPTKEEYAVAILAGKAIGAVGGAANKAINESRGLVYGMSYSDVDKLLLTKKGEPLRDLLKQNGIDWSEDKILKETSKLNQKIVLQKTKNAEMGLSQGWIGTGGVFDNLNPFLALRKTGDSVRMKAFEFEQKTKTLANLQKSLPKDIQEGLEGVKDNKLMREFGADIDSYLDGNEMSEKLGEQIWSADLRKFRQVEDEFYEDLVTVLGSEDRYDSAFNDLNANERQFFHDKVQRAIQDKGYRARQYKALIPGAKEQGTEEAFTLLDIGKLEAKKIDTGENYYDAMFDEIKEWQIKNNPLVKPKAYIDELKKSRLDANGKLSAEDDAFIKKFISEERLVGEDGKSGLIKAHMENLISRNQSVSKKTVFKNTLPGNVEMILKNHIPGKLESNWLGQVTDVGFRMKQGALNISQQLAKFNSNKLVAGTLLEANLISPTPQGEFQTEIKAFGELSERMFTTESVAGALDQIFANKLVDKTENVLIKNVADGWRRTESMSKAVKVLYNPPSYFVNFWSSNLSMFGMGMLPSAQGLKNYAGFVGKGLRQSALLDRAMDYANSVNKPFKKINGKSLADERLDILNEIDELQRLGVLDADTSSLFADDIAAGLKNGKSQINKTIQGITEFTGKIYSLPDVAARLSVFEHNKRMLGKIFPDFASNDTKAFQRMAAEVTNDTYQNYARVSEIIRTASKYGAMPQFVTFTAELVRNVFNQYRIATEMTRGTFGSRYGLSPEAFSKANLDAMRAEGAKRLVFLTGTIGATTVGLDFYNKSNGVDEEKENYYRSIFPQYLKNKSLAFKIDENNPNNVAVMNASYLVPQAIIGSALQAMFAGQDSERDMIQLLSDEFMGEGTFFAKEIYRALDNRDKYGEKITRATEMNEQMFDYFNYVFKSTFETGAQREFQKMQQASQGKGLYSKQEVWLRQFGFRFQKLEVDRFVNFKLQDIADQQSSYKGDYTKALKYELAEGKITEEELEQRYQLNNERMRNSYNELQETYNQTVKQSGLKKDKVDELFTGSRSNLSSKIKISILSGMEYKDMPRTLSMSQQDQYDTMFGEGTDVSQFSESQIRTKINTFKRSDPNKYRAFQRIFKSIKSVNAQKNLTTVQKLLKKLSVYDRATTIMDLGLNNPEEIRTLRRLGIYTDQVKQTIRSLEQ